VAKADEAVMTTVADLLANLTPPQLAAELVELEAKVKQLQDELERHELAAEAERAGRRERAFVLNLRVADDGQAKLLVCDPAGDDIRAAMIAGAVLSTLRTGRR
jgi:hypothetical protein